MSNDADIISEPPPAGSRRVSIRVAIPVVLGCAVLGSVIGVLQPPSAIFASALGDREPVTLSLGSAKLVDHTPASAQPGASIGAPDQPDAIAADHVASEPPPMVPSAVASLSTGAVDRSTSQGAGANATLDTSDRKDATRLESPGHSVSRVHQIARAKRLRRVLWRRVRYYKVPGSGVDKFFASLFSVK